MTHRQFLPLRLTLNPYLGAGVDDACNLTKSPPCAPTVKKYWASGGWCHPQPSLQSARPAKRRGSRGVKLNIFELIKNESERISFQAIYTCRATPTPEANPQNQGKQRRKQGKGHLTYDGGLFRVSRLLCFACHESTLNAAGIIRS